METVFRNLINVTIVDVKQIDNATIVFLTDKCGKDRTLRIVQDESDKYDIIPEESMMGFCSICSEYGYLITVDNPDSEINSKPMINICGDCSELVECPLCGEMNPSYTCFYETHDIVRCCDKCDKE